MSIFRKKGCLLLLIPTIFLLVAVIFFGNMMYQRKLAMTFLPYVYMSGGFVEFMEISQRVQEGIELERSVYLLDPLDYRDIKIKYKIIGDRSKGEIIIVAGPDFIIGKTILFSFDEINHQWKCAGGSFVENYNVYMCRNARWSPVNPPERAAATYSDFLKRRKLQLVE